MLSAFSEIHWVAVVAGTLAFAVLGAAYFLAIVPKQYLYVTGRENLPKEEQAAPGTLMMFGPIFFALITVIADDVLIRALGITSIAEAVLLGLLVAIGFLVPQTFTIAINPLFPRPIQYGLLNAPYFLVANVIACMLLVIIPW
ncbi:MAG: DUF1761 domain-containing protein [Devosia sp.]